LASPGLESPDQGFSSLRPFSEARPELLDLLLEFGHSEFPARHGFDEDLEFVRPSPDLILQVLSVPSTFLLDGLGFGDVPHDGGQILGIPERVTVDGDDLGNWDLRPIPVQDGALSSPPAFAESRWDPFF